MAKINNVNLQDKRMINIIWALAYPIMIGQLLHTLMMLVDIWFVSNYLGESATAAVGASTALMGVIRVMPFLISNGSLSLVARATGANDKDRVRDISKNSLVLSILVGLVVSFLLYINSVTVLRIFGQMSSEVEAYALNYISIAFLSIPFIFFNVTSKATAEATGDTKNPVKIFIAMNVLNIFLDYVFIVNLDFGIRGASLATLISEIFGFIFMFKLLYSKLFKDIKFKVKDLLINIDITISTFKIGFFSMIQMMLRPITGLVMMGIILSMGDSVAAAFSIGARLFDFIFIFLKGLTISVSVLVGQYLGNKDTEKAMEVVKKGIKLAFINMGVFFLIYFLFPKVMISFFTDSKEVIDIGAMYLRICYLGVIFVVFPVVLGGAFTGSGDTMPPMISAFISNLVVKIPLAFILSQTSLEETGVWIAISLSVLVEAVVIIMMFKVRKFKLIE